MAIHSTAVSSDLHSLTIAAEGPQQVSTHNFRLLPVAWRCLGEIFEGFWIVLEVERGWILSVSALLFPVVADRNGPILHVNGHHDGLRQSDGRDCDLLLQREHGDENKFFVSKAD